MTSTSNTSNRSLSFPTPPNQPISPQATTTSTPIGRPARSLQSIISLPEDALYGLPKQLLREYFLTLQQYAQNPYPLPPSLPPTPTSITSIQEPNPTTSPLLRLPLEIRVQIYTLLLPTPSSTPLKGPHPRQLQSPIQLTQPILPSLLLLNQQIRSETLPLLYGSPTQTVHVTINYKIWEHKTRRSDLVLSSALTGAIKHLHLSIHLGSEKRPLASPSLSSHNSFLKSNHGKEKVSGGVGGGGGGSGPGAEKIEAEARLAEVRKGIKKLAKWLSGADLHTLVISWREPPRTYSWEQKRGVLDCMRVLGARRVQVGEINWGLDWNKGRRWRFEEGYLRELERGNGDGDV